jgi:DNA-binding LytR/AlgR family response regulator
VWSGKAALILWALSKIAGAVQQARVRRGLNSTSNVSDRSRVCVCRSIIVNLDRIHGLELHERGEYEVVLKAQARLRLSRRFRKGLQDRWAYSRDGPRSRIRLLSEL